MGHLLPPGDGDLPGACDDTGRRVAKGLAHHIAGHELTKTQKWRTKDRWTRSACVSINSKCSDARSIIASFGRTIATCAAEGSRSRNARNARPYRLLIDSPRVEAALPYGG